MKLTITFEIEVSDIPDAIREQMIADGMEFGEDFPRIADMDEEEVRAEIIDAFYGMFSGSTYDEQSDMWAGSDFYGYITDITAIALNPTPAPIRTENK